MTTRHALACLLIALCLAIGAGTAHADGFVSIDELLARKQAAAEGLFSYYDNAAQLWGFMNGAGEPVIAPRFTGAKEFGAGRAPVQIDGALWGYVDESGELVIPAIFDDAYLFFEDPTLAAVVYDGAMALLTPDGNLLPGLEDVFAPSDGLMRFQQDGLFGFANADGVAIEPQWAEAEDFSEGLAAVTIDPDSEACGFIDKSGQVVLDQFTVTGRFFGGRAFVFLADGETRGFIDKSGVMQTVLPDGSVGFDGYRDGRALCVLLHNPTYVYYYADETGAPAFGRRFDDAYPFEDGYAIASVDGAYGLINVHGNTVLPFEYSYIAPISSGLRLVFKDGLAGYVDVSGKLIIDHQYASASNFRSGLARVTKGEREMYIDTQGRLVRSWIPPV